MSAKQIRVSEKTLLEVNARVKKKEKELGRNVTQNEIVEELLNQNMDDGR